MYKQSATGSIVLSPEHFSLGAGEFLGVTSNTNLALSAPALLEALESALKTAEFEKHPFRSWHDKARAAIAAARG